MYPLSSTFLRVSEAAANSAIFLLSLNGESSSVGGSTEPPCGEASIVSLIYTQLISWMNLLRKGPRQSQQESFLLWEKIPNQMHNSDHPQSWSQKSVLLVVSRNAVILDVKIAWFGCQVAVGIKMQFLGVVHLKSSNLAVCRS